ncbi:protein mono-ADP-ribosyltransferase PARP12-like [Zophobas morio]|uniref:protein mono-ADP-ribosyltransferase PARP12-like n=1 Tax=Zophobas morio TaxID=2755281 RepID=UPI0030830F7C
MSISPNSERCERNPVLIKEILKDPMTTNWEETAHSPVELKEVSENSTEYEEVNELFQETSRGMSITKLERVENPYLLGHYLMKKEKMQNEGSYPSEKSLFHGTFEEYVSDICKYNFDWRKCGNSKGHKFGQGVSFAPEVSYARHYTRVGEDVMILTKVLVGKDTVGDSSTVVPPAPYDTTTNCKDTVFVKYDDDDFYPQYVIHFKWF